MIWFSSDPHFGHWNMIHKFALKDGSPARKFQSTEAMDEHMIAQHNHRVKVTDHWVCLGDVAMDERDMHRVLPRLNGIKHLIQGNHDVFKTAAYLQHFSKIHGASWLYEGLLFSHIPVAPWSFGKSTKANVHGHTHMATPLSYRVIDPLGASGFVKSKLYFNISLERTQYRPVSLEEIRAWVHAAEAH